jgi:hypothetical protein
MELSMHGRFEKPGKSDNHAFQEIGLGFLILPVVITLILVSLAVIQPSASNWIAEAAQAEFIVDVPVSPVKTPTQLAQPTAAPEDGTANWILRIQTAWRGQR